MNLIIIHYHLRPGGVRRVIEKTLPAIIHSKQEIQRVIVVTGEAPDNIWWNSVSTQCSPIPLELHVEPCIGYYDELQATARAIRYNIRRCLSHLLKKASPNKTIIWAHNLAIARNIIFADELTRACEIYQALLISHHHDLWFENRWNRWPEAIKCGYQSISDVARALFPIASNIAHITINTNDYHCFQQHIPNRTAWIPNPCHSFQPTSENEINKTKQELLHNVERVWIMPCRLLRRKNIAEALLLCRWIDNKAALFTTGGISSHEERPYAIRLTTASKKHQWPLYLSIIDSPLLHQHLDAAHSSADMICLSSLQEGFGLTYLEAAAAHRPLLCRTLTNIIPDLKHFGFSFPYLYNDIQIPFDLFNFTREQKHQRQIWNAWFENLPPPFRHYATPPPLLHPQYSCLTKSPVHTPTIPFSRLSLTAQIEVLANQPEASWHISAKYNPVIANYRSELQHCKATPLTWPNSATEHLSTTNYANRFWKIVTNLLTTHNPSQATPAILQHTLVKNKLAAQNMYPLLMATDT